jgi:isopropylmalate/homocitrate/citramalate synthase
MTTSTSEFVATQVRLPKKMHSRLRKIAFTHETSMHRLILDALEHAYAPIPPKTPLLGGRPKISRDSE